MIRARILAVREHEGVSLYEFEVVGALNLAQNSEDSALGGVFASENLAPARLYMLALTPVFGVGAGDEVWLNFKSSDVSLATNRLKNYSVKNELTCEITQILKGEILSVVHLKFGEFEFESIIATSSCERLNLGVGMRVFAYVKSTSIFISETR